MTDFTDFCRPPDVDKRMTRLVISPEMSAGFASQSVSSSSLPEAVAVNDDHELEQVDRFRGQVLQKPCTCRNISSGNANIKQEVTGYQTCNREAILEREKSDPDTNHRDWCGMPDELLFDILLRLPVVSLIRLRSVCKSLCALIGSSAFIAQHFDRNRDKDSLIAVDYSIHEDSSKLCLLSGSKYEVYNDLEYELEWKGLEEVLIGNCCNGIVCIVNKIRGIAELWNPALKQKKRLPESWVSPSSLILPSEYKWMCGFGYDAESNDYKVVKIHLNVEKGGARKSVVEVYSLRGDSWKIIQDAFPVQDLAGRQVTPWQTLSMNGKCYWIGRVDICIDIYCNEVLVSFDLNDERFETMALPAPDEANLEFPPYHALDLLGGKLVCIKGMGNKWPYDALDPTYFQIWVLQDDEDGATKRWSKLHDLGPTSCRCSEPRVLLGFSRDGQYLLISDNPGCFQGLVQCIYLHNFAIGEDGKIETKEDQDPDLVLLSFDHYTESLVSLKGLNCNSY